MKKYQLAWGDMFLLVVGGFAIANLILVPLAGDKVASAVDEGYKLGRQSCNRGREFPVLQPVANVWVRH